MRRSKKESTEKAAALPEDLNRRLGAYALAAGAAGVGVLALAQPAEADIIVKSENIVINSSHPNEMLPIVGGNELGFGFFGHVGEDQWIGVTGLGRYGNYFSVGVITAGPPNFALPLSARVKIGTQQFFHTGVMGGQTLFGHPSFPWNGRHAYLGFDFGNYCIFAPRSSCRFGWAKMSFTSRGLSAHLTEFAYNTVPGQPILAGQTTVPEPGTAALVLLALGALGLSALRGRKRSAVSSQPPANA